MKESVEAEAQSLPPWRRAVLKGGSNLLAADGGGLTPRYALGLANFIASSHAAGREVVLVSSGAVAAGRAMLRQRQGARRGLAARQALAALGQAPMVALWQSLCERQVAQVLLTHDDIANRRRYLNARATLRELLALDVIPVINENDTVAVDELKLGDNDNLAAMVAVLVDADLLLIASDVDALYSANPRCDPAATRIARVGKITNETLAMAGGSGSALGTGGMRTKLEAAAKASSAGIATVIFDGRVAATVQALQQGQLYGTLFDRASTRSQARKHWLRYAPASIGKLVVDAGAARALASGSASLLGGGIVSVHGEFHRGDLIDVRDLTDGIVVRGITQYSAAEARRLAGRHSRDIEAVLGYTYGDEIMHRDDMVTVSE